jgi:hypothetical protein
MAGANLSAAADGGGKQVAQRPASLFETEETPTELKIHTNCKNPSGVVQNMNITIAKPIRRQISLDRSTCQFMIDGKPLRVGPSPGN